MATYCISLIDEIVSLVKAPTPIASKAHSPRSSRTRNGNASSTPGASGWQASGRPRSPRARLGDESGPDRSATSSPTEDRTVAIVDAGLSASEAQGTKAPQSASAQSPSVKAPPTE